MLTSAATDIDLDVLTHLLRRHSQMLTAVLFEVQARLPSALGSLDDESDEDDALGAPPDWEVVSSCVHPWPQVALFVLGGGTTG